jgi:hypothetical protein
MRAGYALASPNLALFHGKTWRTSLPWAVEFVKRFNAYLADFIAFPGFPEQPSAIHRFLEYSEVWRRLCLMEFLVSHVPPSQILHQAVEHLEKIRECSPLEVFNRSGGFG